MLAVQKRPELTARSGFVISQAQAGDSLDRSVLTDFYQPVIGPAAIGTLLTLWSMRRTNPKLSDRQPHTTLLVRLNVGVSTLRSILQNLEAVGLIKTFYRSDEMGDCFVYELQATMTPEAFLNDPLMSVLLLDALGEQDFQRVVKHYRRYQLDTSQLTDVSAKLYDTFHLSADEDQESQSVLQTARANTKVEQPSGPRLGMPVKDFSFETLMTLLGEAGPSESVIQDNKELILTEHVLYGIDEPTMAKLILQSTNLHNQFDARRFKQIVARTYPRVVKQSDSKSTAEEKRTKSAADGKSNNTDQGNSALSPQEKQLEAACQQYSPNEFLAQLKSEAGGGYVTPGETKILQRLIDDGKLSAPVINLLSWYVIADLGHATLSGSFVDAIANTWIRAGVQTVPDALHQIYQHYQQNQQRNKNRRYGRKHPVRRESRPQWQRDEQAGKQVKKTSAQQEEAVKKLLASLHQNDQEQ